MQEYLINSWRRLQARERLVIGWGALLIVAILAYSSVWRPWHIAINHMQETLPFKRADLVWMRQQAELVQQGGVVAPRKVKGQGQSLPAIIDRSAKASGVRDSIQQVIPRQNNREVSVVLEAASFNKWIRWVDLLDNQYEVRIKQLSAERESDRADTAEIRVTFERAG